MNKKIIIKISAYLNTLEIGYSEVWKRGITLFLLIFC